MPGAQCIRGKNAWTSRIGHNRKSGSARRRLFAENVRHMKEFRNVLDTQDAATTERRSVYFVASRQGSRMRRGGPGSCFRTARFDHNDWFAERYFTRSR